jgi:hypothetical protein
MRELVGEEVQTLACPGIVASGGEGDVAPDGEGGGVERSGEGGCGCVGVDAYPREVVAQPRLEIPPHRRREGVPMAAQAMECRTPTG